MTSTYTSTYTMAELDAVGVDSLMAVMGIDDISTFKGFKPSIEDFPRARFAGSLIRHIEQDGTADLDEIVALSDFDLYLRVRREGIEPSDETPVLDFDQVRSISTSTLMNFPCRASISPFPRERYVDAYEGFLEGLDKDVVGTFRDAADLDDFSLYSQVHMNDVEVDLTQDEPKAFVLDAVVVDEAAARTVADLLASYAEGWEEAEYTEIEEWDLVVEKAVQALGIAERIYEYQEAHDDGEASHLEFGPDVEEGSAAAVCVKVVQAQYANGVDLDWNLVSEASEAAAALPSAPRPAVA